MASSSKKSAAEANLLGKRKPENDLETKPILRKHKEKSEEKEVDVRKKALLVAKLSPQTEISEIINFFSDVGQVVRVQLRLRRMGELAGFGYVEFASANEAKQALEKKNGEYLHGRMIVLEVAKAAPQPKYCIEHKVVWYEDYLRRESLLTKVDETVEGLVEEFDARKKTLFVANLSPQTNISHIYDFFNYIGKVVSVRLIVNQEGKHVGCCFVEFATANRAKEVLEEKNGEYLDDHKIFLDVAKIAPYPPRARYNFAEKLWYEDYLLRESLLIDEDKTVEGLNEHPDLVEVITVRKKTLFVANLSPQTEISHIINFFNNVGEVVRVQLILKRNGDRAGCGFVEFASANEAKKALQQKNGEYLHDCKIFLDVANKGATYIKIFLDVAIMGATHLLPKYCIDHKVWYEDYLRRESLLIEEEDETVEGLVEEVATRKKTLFVANLSPQTGIHHIAHFFKIIGKVVSVRLIVNYEGMLVGCGFVEFATANQAKKALQKNSKKMVGHKIFVDVAKISPYPLRPKYNLAEKLWYKDYLRVESFLEKEDDLKTKLIQFGGKKTTFVDDEEAFC